MESILWITDEELCILGLMCEVYMRHLALLPPDEERAFRVHECANLARKGKVLLEEKLERARKKSAGENASC